MLNFSAADSNHFPKIEKRQQEKIHRPSMNARSRSDLRGSAERKCFLIGFAEGNVEKYADAAQEVERMRARENVEKLLAWLLAIYHALRDQCRHAISCPATNKIPSP